MKSGRMLTVLVAMELHQNEKDNRKTEELRRKYDSLFSDNPPDKPAGFRVRGHTLM